MSSGVGYSAIGYVPAGVEASNQQLFERMSAYFLAAPGEPTDELLQTDDRIALVRGDWSLQVGLRRDPVRLATAREVALPHARTPQESALIETCAGIFYLQTTLDSDGSHFDDYVGALECIEQVAPGVLLYDMASGDFI